MTSEQMNQEADQEAEYERGEVGYRHTQTLRTIRAMLPAHCPVVAQQHTEANSWKSTHRKL